MSNTKELPTDPDWSKAPDWATHHAINESGIGYWSEVVMFKKNSVWRNSRIGFIQESGYYSNQNWKNSLQKRPETTC